MSSILQRIKKIRKVRKLTQNQFAEELGVDRSHISKIETGTATPSKQLLKLICSKFQIREEWLLEQVEAGESAALNVDSTEDFERFVLSAEHPVLVDFYSNSCPPCRRLAPTIEELATEYQDRAVVCKVNVDRARELAGRYGIQGIPAVLFFVDGEPIRRLVGLQSRDTYAKVLDELTS